MNFGPKGWDIAGYTYRAENYRPGDLLTALIADGQVAAADRETGSVEEILDQVASTRGIDRGDERSFDSGDFPKVIFESQITDEDADWYDS